MGHDTHRLIAGRALVLGGVGFEHSHGPDAHSDGDVALHALADALLGAAGLGDIGEHFPDTDARFRGFDSQRLLAEVVAMVDGAGYRIGNCDLTIHAERPKIGPRKEEIRANVARLLGIDRSAVNIKAKTGEAVGPVGRGEALMADAIVSIERFSGES
jgi:2-C-methyl-D-erythritol 2,4-cyclodiphosphate synthase